jgi:hypothetical protein
MGARRPDFTEFTPRRQFLTPRARRGDMEPVTRVRKSPIPATLGVGEAAAGECRHNISSKQLL